MQVHTQMIYIPMHEAVLVYLGIIAVAAIVVAAVVLSNRRRGP